MPIVDVGVSREEDAEHELPLKNFFLKTFRYSPENYTGLGIQDLSGMEQRYPGTTFVQYPGGTFPFKDKTFEWAFSNAAIEHAGDDAAQLNFVNEMMRVTRNVFFTTPNRYFPVESHTNVLFLHWNNELFYLWCSKYKPWCTKNSVYLLFKKWIESIMQQSDAHSFHIYKNRLFEITMTFTVLSSK